jgi:hypothetical protein
MRSLCTIPRRLFWRRRQPKLCKLSQHFFFGLVRNFPVHLVHGALEFCTTRLIISKFYIDWITLLHSLNIHWRGTSEIWLLFRICELWKHNVIWRLKAGMVKSEKTAIARPRLVKHVPVETDLGQSHIHGNDFLKDKQRQYRNPRRRWSLFGFPEAKKWISVLTRETSLEQERERIRETKGSSRFIVLPSR